MHVYMGTPTNICGVCMPIFIYAHTCTNNISAHYDFNKKRHDMIHIQFNSNVFISSEYTYTCIWDFDTSTN